MAFVYAYSINGNHAEPISDFPLDTVTNYKTSVGTNNAKKGDLVFQSSGLLRRAIATTGASLGVLEGQEFTGLIASGQPYAATKASFLDEASNTTLNPNGVGKVRTSKQAVYKVAVNTAGAVDLATNAHLGGSYTIALDAAGDQTVDLNTTTNACVKVVDFTPDGKHVFVTLV